MSTTIDQKVVEMRFDNKNFERNVSETMSTLEKFKQKLNLTGASKGLENINNTASKFNMNGMNNAIETVRASFSKLEVMGITALANLTNSAVNYGKRIAKALTIDPIMTGFSEYETQINAVQTILANTESKGTTLQDVNQALDELNLYADKTIYNFTEMTRNIGTFTAAGVDLKTSVSAIQGIANLAAVSGSTSQQASTAMYQLSQALSSGTVKLMDWNSVVNAGMGGQVFQDALKATARVHGVKVDQMIKKNGSFRESLQEGWITSEILTETLNKFTMAAEEGSEQWNTYKKSLTDQGYTSKQAEEILKMANTATEAATKVKTFTQLWDTLKESAQSGWTQTWEIIVGDFGEAKEFLTTISDTIGGMLNASSEARNNLLSGGLSTGWKQLLGSGIADEEGFKETLQKVAKKNGFEFDKLIKDTEKNGGTFNDALKKALTDGNITSDTLTQSVSELSKKMQGMSAKQRETAGYTKEHVQEIKELDEALKNGSISMDDFVKKMMRPSGRENLIESLSNTFKGLMNIVNPIKEAFREIFPAATSEQLYNFTVKLKELTSKFAEFTEKYGPKIKSTFKGFFAVIDIGVTFLKELANGIGELLGNFKGVTGGILDASGSLGDWLMNLRDSIKESDLFGRAIDKIVGFIQKVIDKIKELAGPGIEVFMAIFKFISKLGSSIGEALGNSIRNGDIVSLIDIFNTGVFAGILLKIKNFIGDFKGAFENIGEVLESFKGILEAYQQDLQAKTLLKIATAIGILAAALLVLALIDPGRLGTAILAISTLFAELLGGLAIFGKIAGNIGSVFKASVGIIALSSALLILSVAMKIMSTIEWQQMLVALGGVVVGLWALVKAVTKLPETKVAKAASAIKKLSGALLIFAIALKIMGSMELTEMAIALGGVVVGLTALVIAVNKLPENTKARVAGLMGLATALVIFGAALKIISTMDWKELGLSLGTIAIGLTAMVVAIKKLPEKGIIGKATGMMILATSLVILGGALKILSSMSWQELGLGLGTIALSLTALVVALRTMPVDAGAKSLAMMGMATSLVFMAKAIKTVGNMDPWNIVKGLLGLAGAFIIIGVAAALLTPIAPTLLTVAGAFALFGLATLGIGVGLGLIAAGISALALAVSTGTTAIVAGLSAIILGIVGLFPEIMKTLGECLVLLCNIIIETAPLIAETILVVISEVLASLAKHGPEIVESLFEFVIGLLKKLRDYIPDFIVVAVEIIGAFFEGVVDALNGLDTTNLLKGIVGLGLLTGLMMLLGSVASFIPGALVGVLGMGLVIAELALVLAAVGALAQIPGLSWLIEEGGNFLQKLGTAIGQFIGGILGGIAKGATSTLPEVGTNLSEFMKNLKPFIDGAKTIDSTLLEGVKSLAEAMIILTGANLLDSLTSWLTGGSSLADFGKELAEFGKYMGEYSNAVNEINIPAVLASSMAAKYLAEVADLIPSDGIFGTDGIDDFGKNVVTFGKKLKEYGNEVSGINAESITASIDPAKSLIELGKNLPKDGVFGTDGIDDFGKNVVTFGRALKEYGNEVSGLNHTAILGSVLAAGSLTEVAKTIPDDGTFGGDGIDDFGDNIYSFAKSLKKYSDKIGEVSMESINKSVTAVKSLMYLINNLAGINTSGVDTFKDAIYKLGQTNIDEFIKSFNDSSNKVESSIGNLINNMTRSISTKTDSMKKSGIRMMDSFINGLVSNKMKATSAMGSIANSSAASISNYSINFYNAGSYLVTGFANGISDNQYKAVAKARAMAVAAETAAREALKINSPSKVFREIGSGVPEGFAQGITMLKSDIKQSVSNMSDMAISGTKNAISRIVDAINSDMDTQPTIRPILDLSEVESGAGYLSSMFNDGPSVGVMSNLRAISSGMNIKNQNGQNSDVISAINKLGKSLGNVKGDTYNIDGITYDDGSNITDAVKTLVRAAKVGRRT